MTVRFHLWISIFLAAACVTCVGQENPTNEEVSFQELIYQFDEAGVQFVVGETMQFDASRLPAARRFPRPQKETRDFGPVIEPPSSDRIVGLRIERGTDPDGTLTDEMIATLIDSLPRLEAIMVTHNGGFARRLGPHLHRCTRLRYLNVSHDMDCSKETSDQFVDALKNFDDLRVLELRGGYLDDAGVSSLQQLGKLQRLVLMPLKGTTPESRRTKTATLSAAIFSRVVMAMPDLTELELSRCNLTDDFDWQALGKHVNLRKCQFRWVGLSDERMIGIDALDQVTSLNLYYSPITGKSLAPISGMASLQSLTIHSTQVHSGIMQLKAMPHLKTLAFSQDVCRDEYMTPQMFQFLTRVGSGSPLKLNSKKLSSIAELDRQFGGITKIEQTDNTLKLSYLNDKGLLKHQRLRKELTPSDNAELTQLKSLTTLRVHNQPITSAESNAMRGLARIEELDLGQVELSREVMNDFASIPMLKKLTIETANIGPGAFVDLKNATKLETLTIGGDFDSNSKQRLVGIENAPALTDLTLQILSLGDDDCEIIAGSQTVQALHCEGTFSKLSLSTLATMNRLERLTLLGLKIEDPDRDLRRLRSPTLRQVRLAEPNGIHFGTIYSELAAWELGITMAGECSCTCMDVRPPDAVLVSKADYEIKSDVLRLKPSFLAKFAPVERRTQTFRVADPIRRHLLIVRAADVGGHRLIVADCVAKRVELHGTLNECGLFGKIDELVLRDSPSPQTGNGWINLHCNGVASIRVETSKSLTALSLHGISNSLRFVGSFPKLKGLEVSRADFQYLAAPFSGSAPQLKLSGGLRAIDGHERLRFLKLPGTAIDDKSWFANRHDFALSPPPLYEIDLRQTQISDAVLDDLQQVSTLRILKLHDCPNVTNQGIKRLQNKIPGLVVQR